MTQAAAQVTEGQLEDTVTDERVGLFTPDKDRCTADGMGRAAVIAARRGTVCGEAQLDAAYAKHRRRLPPGGPVPPDSARFFSDRFLWSRLPASTPPDELVSLLLPAMEDYTRAYLRLLADPPPRFEYATYRTERDPARPMLSRLFGEEAAGRLLRESLFDLPLRLARGEQAH
ncbi:hypothetical protein EMIHUDRAFT_245098 [Emiliania huxleyi CCMP1516]|uniref:Uncharacterized protein n=2 Tax=Emiliania huxleyi TaxID=2903 RepID=A0A0D3IYY3_EMIH1|nr:hypothetical protein EMIHUDRAFT_245098 [Emiliania huxleyi CCMP1516]EOD16468.1 hypothetical protein EMIHUDRAFT_245098 [Emiliania huxleyi CCMP1516]|eukprot:XP_005768897.1 hypothetical protein EMIHUDRAFT_245098 [Emiliania huxleyi CCMP1516]